MGRKRDESFLSSSESKMEGEKLKGKFVHCLTAETLKKAHKEDGRIFAVRV